MTIRLPIWHSHCTRVRFTVLVTCGDELAVHLISFFACRGRLRNSGANCSAIGLCCVTTTWQQIFEDALGIMVVGMCVRREGQNGHLSRPGNWDLEPKFLVKLVALFGLSDLIFAITVYLPLIHCKRVRSSVIQWWADVCSFACKGRLRYLWAEFSAVVLCSVTITRQQIFKGSLQVTVVRLLPHVMLNAEILEGNAGRQWLLVAARNVVLYCVKISMSGSVALLPRVWKIRC